MAQQLAPFHLAIPVHDLAAARSGFTPPPPHHNEVDGNKVPVPHFGVVLEWASWHSLAQRLEQRGVLFV